MGRESSTKAQVSDVHRHFPAIGSQNGVEQLAGTGQEMSWGDNLCSAKETNGEGVAAGQGV